MSLSSFEHTPWYSWSPKQTMLTAICFLPMLTFSKLPFDQYLGSGWTLLCTVLTFLFFVAPLAHLQFRLGCCHQEGLLTLQVRELPFTMISGIAAMITNLIKLIVGSVFLTYCIAYLIFLIYQCDGKHCVGAYYMWGSCRDVWSEGDCKDGYVLVYSGPTAEEKFMTNYVQMRTDRLESSEGFPFWPIIPGGIFIPYTLAWLSLFLLTFCGHRMFGIWLYILAPSTAALVIGIVVSFGFMYANSANQLSTVAARFYSQFSAIVPVDEYARDQFVIRPLVWGFLATFVHLSQAMNLWTGVFTILGKWNRTQGRTKHVTLLSTILVAAFLINIPVLMIMFASASAFDLSYLRCHLGTDWLIPFVLVTHVFSKFSTHRILTGAFFVCLFLCVLLHNSLLLITTLTNISDLVKRMSFRGELRSRKKKFRLMFFLILPVLIALGLPMITRSGFFWIRLVDWFVDRLLVVNVILQATGFLVAYRRLQCGRRESPALKMVFVVLYGVIVAISLAIYAWYTASVSNPTPDSGCLTYSAAPRDDPLTNIYRYVGWTIATGPLLFGVVYFILQTAIRSWRTNQSFLYTCITGEAYTHHTRTEYSSRYPYDPIHQYDYAIPLESNRDHVVPSNSTPCRGYMWR